MTPQPTVLATAGTAASPKLVTLDESAKAAPKMSAPVASNVGNAPFKVSNSETFAADASGATQPLPPLVVPKGVLGKPETVVQAASGAIPKGQGTKVIATFVRGQDDVDTFRYNPVDAKAGVPNAGGKFVCRVDSIDGPEIAHGRKPAQVYGAEAAAVMEQMIANKQVTIKVTGQDAKNRDICQVEIQGVGLDSELIKAGAAMIYERFVPFGSPRRAGLEAAQADAKANKRGIWGQKEAPIPPWQFRRSIENIPY